MFVFPSHIYRCTLNSLWPLTNHLWQTSQVCASLSWMPLNSIIIQCMHNKYIVNQCTFVHIQCVFKHKHIFSLIWNTICTCLGTISLLRQESWSTVSKERFKTRSMLQTLQSVIDESVLWARPYKSPNELRAGEPHHRWELCVACHDPWGGSHPVIQQPEFPASGRM